MRSRRATTARCAALSSAFTAPRGAPPRHRRRADRTQRNQSSPTNCDSRRRRAPPCRTQGFRPAPLGLCGGVEARRRATVSTCNGCMRAIRLRARRRVLPPSVRLTAVAADGDRRSSSTARCAPRRGGWSRRRRSSAACMCRSWTARRRSRLRSSCSCRGRPGCVRALSRASGIGYTRPLRACIAPKLVRISPAFAALGDIFRSIRTLHSGEALPAQLRRRTVYSQGPYVSVYPSLALPGRNGASWASAAAESRVAP